MKMLTAVFFALTVAGTPGLVTAQPNVGINSLAWANKICAQQGGSQVTCMMRQLNVRAPQVLVTSESSKPAQAEACKTLLGCGPLLNIKLPKFLAPAGT
jgi:stage III sporulation protein SpoIIIAA